MQQYNLEEDKQNIESPSPEYKFNNGWGLESPERYKLNMGNQKQQQQQQILEQKNYNKEYETLESIASESDQSYMFYNKFQQQQDQPQGDQEDIKLQADGQTIIFNKQMLQDQYQQNIGQNIITHREIFIEEARTQEQSQKSSSHHFKQKVINIAIKNNINLKSDSKVATVATNSYIKQQTKNYEEYKHALKSLDDDQFKNKTDISMGKFYQMIGFYFKFMIMPWLTIINSFVGIVNLILLSYVDQGFISAENKDPIQLIEFLVGVLFIIEFLYQVYMEYGPLYDRIVQYERLIEILNIFEIAYQKIGLGSDDNFIIFLKIFRSLRCQKLRTQIKKAQYYWFVITNQSTEEIQIEESKSDAQDKDKQQQKNDADIEKDFQEKDEYQDDNRLNKFIISSIFDLINGIFIESTVVLAVNKYREYQGFTEVLDYVSAAYYILVSLSSIGYGDIYAIDWFSRQIMVILLVINITVMSTFLGNFTNLLFQLSSFDTEYLFHDHIVIIGEYEDYFIYDLCGEIAEVDQIYRRLHGQGMKVTNEEGQKIIIVGADNPSYMMRNTMAYYEQSYIYDNEIVYLKQNIYDKKNKSWFKKASLNTAKHILALSYKFVPDQEKREEMDKQLTIVVKSIKDRLSTLKILLILQTNLADSFKKDTNYSGIEMCKIYELSQCIMSSSIENQGFGTILTHILTMKQKNQPVVNNTQSLYFKYVQEMDQEIYEYKFPNYFFGKSFQEACIYLYIYNLELGGDAPLTKHSRQDERTLLLIAVQNKKDFYINPVSYTIQEGDVGYCICHGIHDLQKSQLITEETHEKQYKDNKNFLIRSTKDQAKNKRIIDELFLAQVNRLQTFKMPKRLKCKAGSPPKQIQINYFNQKEGQFLNKCFSNHIIICGQQNSFGNIIKIVRMQTNRPIVLFCQKDLDHLIWNQITSNQSNIYFAHGNMFDINHLEDLNIQKCHKLLILSDQDGIIFNDSDAIVLAKIVFEHFQVKDYIIELRDEENIKFLSLDPNLRKYEINETQKNKSINPQKTGDFQIYDQQKEAAPFFWTAFVQGNVYFSSVSATVMARHIFNNKWMNFIEDLVTPTLQQKSFVENKIVNSLVISSEAAKHFELYGILQYSLMNFNPKMIAIGIVKTELDSQYKLKRNGIYQRTFSQFSKQDLNNVLYKYGGFQVVLTNPSFYTTLDEGDTVIVMGYNKHTAFKQDGTVETSYVKRLSMYRSNEIPKLPKLSFFQKNKNKMLKQIDEKNIEDDFLGDEEQVNDSRSSLSSDELTGDQKQSLKLQQSSFYDLLKKDIFLKKDDLEKQIDRKNRLISDLGTSNQNMIIYMQQRLIDLKSQSLETDQSLINDEI